MGVRGHDPSALELIAELRTTLGKMEIALGAIMDAITWIDGSGSIQWCNSAFDQLVNKPHIGTLGKNLVDLLPLEQEGKRISTELHPVGILLAHQSKHVGIYWFSQPGGVSILEVTGKRIDAADAGRGVVLVIRDITSQWQAENDRINLMREQMLRVKAEEAVRGRDEFMLIASHELKTPLTALSLQAALVKRSSTGTQTEKITVLQRQIDRLSGLVERVLDISRMAMGQLTLEVAETDLSKLTQDVVAGFKAELDKAHYQIESRIEDSVVGVWDRSRIEQVVVNLLSNAMKYGSGKLISIGVKSEKDKAICWVQDHGIGIEKKDQANIFERFERFVSPDHYGGLGLGLYITRQIVNAHGGSIRVRSEIGKGSTFVVELPLSI
jgi:signal transduction histidine kinase